MRSGQFVGWDDKSNPLYNFHSRQKYTDSLNSKLWKSRPLLAFKDPWATKDPLLDRDPFGS